MKRRLAAPALPRLAAVALALAFACRLVVAQPSGLDTVPADVVPSAADSAKSWAVPIAEIIAFDLLLSR